MARDWPHLPQFNSIDEILESVPSGWGASQVSDLYDRLPVGKRFELKTTSVTGLVPVLDQSSSGIIGWHNEAPGVEASHSAPVVTFANHTCEMRIMRRPFSVIQNVFPLVGRHGICDTTFLYYLTKGRVWLEEYKGHYPDYRRKYVAVPPLTEQRAIASILNAFDAKIESNRKMSETLEATAQALFKSWFVDFDPVHTKSEGRETDLADHVASLFPSTFDRSVNGPIPTGWTMKPLAAVASIVGGKQLPTVDCRDFGTFPVFGANGIMGYTDAATHTAFVIAFGRVGANCGSVNWSGNGAWINNNATAVVPWSWGWLVLQAMLAFDFTQLRTGSAQPFIPNSSLASVPILVPTDAVARAFCDFVEPIRRRQHLCMAESATLGDIRDLLLPQLISGELRVPDAAAVVAGAPA